jgi:hypothetical protein
MRYLIILVVVLFSAQSTLAQTDTTKKGRRVLREPVPAVASKVTVYPYATISLNYHSGQAFPKSATGIGYGFGLAFDLTEDKQPIGVYFDIAYQDMRAQSPDGGCMDVDLTDSNEVSQTVATEHYFSYALFEAFLKLQSEKAKGYFLVGLSTGLVTSALTVKRAPDPQVAKDVYSEWKSTSFFNKLRLDLRAGIGVQLGYIAGYPFVLEARFGYPIIPALTEYDEVCNANDAKGPWRILSLQANVGLRF